jgi:hypothetical protein
MLAFAEATLRLADLARGAGHATDAVNELWPLVARLEARAAEGHLEADTLSVLGRAWTSLGTCLGTVLPEERLTVAAQWTGKGVAAAEHLGDPGALSRALAMHGNELRKGSRVLDSVAVLERAAATANEDRDTGTAMALLARAAGELGDAARFDTALARCWNLLDRHGPAGPLLHPFTIREIHLRGMLDMDDITGAVALVQTPPVTPAPAPQWHVIERITAAGVLLAAGDHDQAEQDLTAVLALAVGHRLPHQIQRIVRIAGHRGLDDALDQQARAALTAVCSRPVLGAWT